MLLLVGYAFLSFNLGLFSIRSDGYGSKVPLAIAYSWGLLPWEYCLVSGGVGFWLLPLFYMVCLFTLTTTCARSSRLTVSLSSVAFHAIGVVIALMNVEPGEPVTFGYLTASVLVTGAYLWFGWSMARRQRPTQFDEAGKRHASGEISGG